MANHLKASPPIEQLHCWVGLYADGSEGILSADFPMEFGTRHAPLFSSRLHVVQRMEHLANEILERSRTVEQSLISVELRSFVRVVD